jgi:hypothetical protein
MLRVTRGNLETAGLLPQSGSPVSAPLSRRRTFLDLGFGCGDQTLYLTQGLLKTTPSLGRSDQSTLQRSPLLDKHTGITLDPGQYSYANEILASRGASNDPAIEIFCNDAANPTVWDDEFARAVKNYRPVHRRGRKKLIAWLLLSIPCIISRPHVYPCSRMLEENEMPLCWHFI